jgi:tetratricopeptide (TPR) repeat protein
VGRFAASPAGLSRLSAAFGSLGHHQEAARAARHALALQPDLEEALRSLLINLPMTSDATNRTEAIEIGKALASKTHNPSDWALLSRALNRDGQLEEAIKVARHALSLAPNSEEAFRSLLINLPLTSDPKNRTEAIEVGKALTSRTNDPSDWALLSRALSRDGQLEEAIKVARHALSLEPDLEEAFRSLLINLPMTSDARNRTEAIEIGKALASKTDNPSDWALLSAAYGQNGQYTESVESAIAALKLDPRCTQAYQGLAMILGKAKGQEAERLRGLVLTKVGISDDALREAVASNPNDSNMWRLLTWSLTDKGQCSNAALIASNALNNDPELHEVVFSVDEELRDPCPDEALHLLSDLIAIDGRRRRYWNFRGVLNRDLGQFEVACLDHKRALTLDPRYPDAWYALGRTYETMGRHGDACAAYSRALVLKPGYIKALHRKQALGC